jgi:hypothetical protein
MTTFCSTKADLHIAKDPIHSAMAVVIDNNNSLFLVWAHVADWR